MPLQKRSPLFRLAVAWALIAGAAARAAAQNPPPVAGPQVGQDQTLGRLSIEELSRIDVTSVSKHAEPVSEAPFAIGVITAEDLRRAGITTLAEALRLATGMAVGRADAHTWAISARGFNITTANKMAVFIDGRSVYTPLFSGVFWDVQDYALSDLDRIEIIRGPAGTLWGANAVNGVINIISKSAMDTKGGLIRLGGGDVLGQGSVRYGIPLGTNGALRVFTKYRYHRSELLANGEDGQDPLRRGQAGFRADKDWSGRTALTLQGDFYKGLVGIADRPDSDVHGGNLLARLSHTFDSGGQLQVQSYYDHTFRDVPRQYAEDRNTIDTDVQYRFSLGARHALIAGAGVQYARGRVTPSTVEFFDPPARTTPLFSAFVQDDIVIRPGRVDVIVGSKVEHNVYTGVEYQPTIRGRWMRNAKEAGWVAVSRAVRMPTRYDTDLRFTGGAPFVVLRGDPGFRSETIVAREAGYRRRLSRMFSVDGAVFLNTYKDLRSLEPTPPTGFPLVIGNLLTARTSGLELTTEFEPGERWRLHGGYTFLHERFRLRPESRDAFNGTNEYNDPSHQFWLRSYFNPADNIELDATMRSVASLPHPSVPAYTELTLHFGWRFAGGFDLSLIGDNLLHDQHPEFGALNPRPEFRRSFFAQATWAF